MNKMINGGSVVTKLGIWEAGEGISPRCSVIGYYLSPKQCVNVRGYVLVSMDARKSGK